MTPRPKKKRSKNPKGRADSGVSAAALLGACSASTTTDDDNCDEVKDFPPPSTQGNSHLPGGVPHTFEQPACLVVGSPAPVLKPRKHLVLYSEDVADRVVDAFIGGMSFLRISKLPGMPAYGTILRWLSDNKDFKEKMRSAREVRAVHFEEMALYVACDGYDA